VEHNYLGSIQLKPNDPEPYYQLSKFDWNFVLGTYSVVLVVLDFLWLIANMAGQGDGTANAVHLAGALAGWVSVGGFHRFSGPWTRIQDKNRAKKQRKSQAKTTQDAERMDQILAKISREGLPSLSSEEKRFLQQQSEKKSR